MHLILVLGEGWLPDWNPSSWTLEEGVWDGCARGHACMYVRMYVHTYMCVCLSVYLTACLPVYPTCLPACLLCIWIPGSRKGMRRKASKQRRFRVGFILLSSISPPLIHF